MPSASKHLRRAQRHLQVADKWSADEDSLGWATVALFYAARDIVHAVFDADETLAAVCKHPESHANIDLNKPGTNTVIKRHYRAVEIPYMALYAVSRGVRYQGQIVGPSLWDESRQEFREICGWATQELRTARRVPPDWLVADSGPTS